MKGGKMMAYTQNMAVHEKMELHELLTFKTACAFKAAMMQNQVQDAQLRGLLNQDITNTRTQIQELQGLLQGTMQ
jgi:similar to spore coat protein